MAKCVMRLVGVSMLSWNKMVSVPKEDKELPDAYEERTWKHRGHYIDNGSGPENIFIPPMAFKKSIAAAARYLGLKIPGEKNRTWTKHFQSGVQVFEPLILPETFASIKGEWLMVPSDGKPGGKKRVRKCFPYVTNWEGDVTWHILDDKITEKVFISTLECAGKFIGILRFRPENGGFYGRFKVAAHIWEKA